MSPADDVRSLKTLSGAERLRTLDSLVYASNRDDQTGRELVDAGLLNIVWGLVKNAPEAAWNDDSAAEDEHPDWWLAFDILTNLCKWTSVRNEILKAGVVDFLAARSKQTNYFGFESTEGLAYIVGRDDQGSHSSLLQARPESVDLIIKILDSALDGNGTFFGMRFGIYGRVLALQCLSLSDANKPMLRPAVPLLIKVIQNYSYDAKSCDLSAKALLELSFDAGILASMQTEYKDTFASLIETCSTEELASTKKALSALVFRIEESLKKPATSMHPQPGTSGMGKGHVMISYNWKSQPIVRVLADELKKSNIPVWIDFDQMQGDTIEAMALAVEQCAIFIMCMTESYKESANCRLEANYAFKHRKHMIPIMMEQGYNPSGWLGALASNMLYYEVYDTPSVKSNAPKLIGEIQGKLQNGGGGGGGSSGGAAGGASGSKTPASPSGPSPPPLAPLAAPARKGLSPKVSGMTPEQVAAFVKTQCNLPKLESVIRKAGVSGHHLAVVLDMHASGGPAVATLQELGFKKPVEALEVLFQLLEVSKGE